MGTKRVALCALGVMLLSIGQLTSPKVYVPSVADVPADMHLIAAGHNETSQRPITASNLTESKPQVIHIDSAASDNGRSVLASTSAISTTNDTKPRMVLHIGPYKHATTFLQQSMSLSGYKLLEEDNYVYIGTCSGISHREARKREICIGHSAGSLHGQGPGNRFQPELLEILPKLHAQGRNAMIVWEYFSDIGQRWLTEFLHLLEGWELKVIVAYRPAYEFLPSFLAQVQRPHPYRERYRTWPSEGGHAIVPFDMYPIEDLVDLQVDLRYQVAFRHIKNRAVHPTEYARRLWKRAGFNETTVIDMTQLGSKSESGGDPLLIHLFCSVLDDTPTMCEAARTNTVTWGRDNSRFPINYDLLAVAAASKGILSTNVTRAVAWAMIQRRQESILNKTSADFPLVCLSNKSMEELLHLSVASELTIFSSRVDVASHGHRFQKAVQKKKFCRIDADAVLQDSDWVAYLASLGLVCQRKKCKPMVV